MSPKKRISLTALSRKLGMHRNTLRQSLKAYNINYSFSKISENHLDHLVRTFHTKKPDAGIRYLIGFLRLHDIYIPKARVVESRYRVDPVGARLRLNRRTQILRTEYKVPRPNSLWHIDGHHKLILWGFVLHGCVDGFSRMVSTFCISKLYEAFSSCK